MDNFYYHSQPRGRNIIDVKEYDYFVDSLSLMDGSTQFEDINITYNINNHNLRIFKYNELLLESDLKKYANTILNKLGPKQGKHDTILNQEDAAFVVENENVKVKLIVTSLTGRTDSISNEHSIEHVEFYMLVKVK